MKNNAQYHTASLSPAELICNYTAYDMIVFCNGGWDQTYKKTLCFLDRNAGAKILYIEKPLAYDPAENPAKFIMINDSLHVLRPNVASIDAVFKLLPHYVRTKSVAVGWFASADFMHFGELIRFKTIINNCSELSPATAATHTSEAIGAQKPALTKHMPRRNRSQFPVAS
jgi:hypothetical protein